MISLKRVNNSSKFPVLLPVEHRSYMVLGLTGKLGRAWVGAWGGDVVGGL